MKNRAPNRWQQYFQTGLLLLIPIVFGFSPLAVPEASCPGPQVSVTSQSTGAASFSWGSVDGATQYMVYYVRQSDNHTSQPIQTTSTSIVFSGLTSGYYNFCFATVCGSELSGWIIIEDLVI